MLKELPEKGELVVCTVTKAKGFGAFVKLEEYPDKKGFIHIKEVAPGWIKNIREHVREGQRIVCKVMDVDPSKGYVDLSLKRVNEHQRREKIQQWKNEQKAKKLLEIVCREANVGEEECNKIAEMLYEKFENLYTAFEEVLKDEKILEKEGFEGNWIEVFIKTAKENIPPPIVEIVGYVEMTCYKPDGIKYIKEALKKLEGKFDGVEIKARYVSAPIYRIEVTAPDYKIAEKLMKQQVEKAIQYIKKHGGTASFKREIK